VSGSARACKHRPLRRDSNYIKSVRIQYIRKLTAVLNLYRESDMRFSQKEAALLPGARDFSYQVGHARSRCGGW
jgi:hypothetical protein